MIETEGLTKQFDQLIAVDNVHLRIRPGEVLALLGPNGAGKTTTVRMLTAIIRPTRGWARVAGFDVVENPQQVRARVGVLTELHGLYERMPANDYLDFFGQIYGMSKIQRTERIQNLLAMFGIAEEQKRRIGEYSKGMRQKLALARALLHDPPVLLLDEPTSAMDPESARLVRDAIHALRSAQRAILICTHNLAEAEELADQIAIIRKGRIIIQGTPAELKRRLMGPTEFEVRFGIDLDGKQPSLPPQVALTTLGARWLRFRAEHPEESNPSLLAELLQQGFPVISLAEVPRSLEQVYLQAVSTEEEILLSSSNQIEGRHG